MICIGYMCSKDMQPVAAFCECCRELQNSIDDTDIRYERSSPCFPEDSVSCSSVVAGCNGLIFSSCGSAVGATIVYVPDDRWVKDRISVSQEFSPASRPALGPTQRPTDRVPGPVSVGITRSGREGDSPLDIAEVKKT
jgi:hypothetical protein